MRRSPAHLALALTVAVAATCLGVASAGAAQPTDGALLIQTAKGGTIRDGRLTLRGVNPHLVWFTDRPQRRAGTVSFARARRALFGKGQAAPNAALDIAGRGLGGVIPLRLSKPRFRPAAGVVSYRVKRLRTIGGGLADHFRRHSRKPLPARFGSASLFIDNTLGSQCTTTIINATGHQLMSISASKWPTDEWDPELPIEFGLGSGGDWSWGSQGGAFRGCSNSATWQFFSGATGTFTLKISEGWSDTTPSVSCVSSNPAFRCLQVHKDIDSVTWSLGPTP